MCRRMPTLGPALTGCASPPRYLSPLRYPGGKARMAGWLGRVLDACPDGVEVFFEPFAGGAGAGLALLAADAVDELWLAEANPALAAFWRTVLSDADAFAARVDTCVPDLALWHASRDILADGRAGEADLAFAAFVVNRCSRSGIIDTRAGPIGGAAQTGRWRIDARFNGPALAGRIRRLARWAGRIRLVGDDGIGAIAELADSGLGEEVLVFADPPYLGAGPRLYGRGFSDDDHRALAEALAGCPSSWVCTYDDDPSVVTGLYPHWRILAFGTVHSAGPARDGRELAVLADGLVVPEVPPIPNREWAWVRR